MNLRRLDLRFTQIEELPWQLSKCRSLEILQTDKSRLEGFMDELSSVKLLAKKLGMKEKELAQKLGHRGSTRKVEMKTMAPVLQALELLSTLKDKETPAGHFKLMIVGNTQTGKTTLSKSIRGKARKRKQAASTSTVRNLPHIDTSGISIGEWDAKGPSGSVNFSVWDFGGQDVSHGQLSYRFTMGHIICSLQIVLCI